MATPLINAAGLKKAFGIRTLFEGVDLVISEGDRIGVIGPNGAGKSTLLEILAGAEEADEGSVIRRRGLRVAFVPQEEDLVPDDTVISVVLQAAAESADPGTVETEVEREVRVRIVLDQVGFADPERLVGELSGGWCKRVAIAAALARQPDVLLLDEPTNHLDLEGILWLEKLLRGGRFAYAVISHDRAFLQQVALRMIEVSPGYPGGLLNVSGDYRTFLEERAAFLQSRARYREGLANRVRRELEWLSRGPKARTTKAQARIDQAEQMQEELAEIDRRRPTGPVGVDFEASGRRTKRLLVATGLGAAVEQRRLFEGLDLLLGPGHRVGVVGPNGCGKTTLLKILAGERDADAGSIRTAEHLKVVYFDQAREHLDVEQSLRRALAGPSDAVVYRNREIHVVTWAHRFGFRTDQLDLAVRELSGGERARIHIARMMLRPADLLILDEPTNDLDILTLEVLEESLLDFPGAVVLVTHDRMLLDTVCTTLIGLDGKGAATGFADSDQWLEARSAVRAPRSSPKKAERPRRPKKAGLSYLEKREFEGMEEAILEAETALEEAAARLEDPAVQTDADAVHEAFEAQRRAQRVVDGLYARWAELEARNQN